LYYESVFVLSGQLSEKAASDKFGEFIKSIESSGAKILKKEFWGLRELAYKIKKNSRAYYYMINSDCDSSLLNSFHSKVKLDENFLRFLNIKIKQVDDFNSPLVERGKK
tara:strand:- start:637 stop:963 length:327 start_codon:yes stop_codon:yes gene_type:complete